MRKALIGILILTSLTLGYTYHGCYLLDGPVMAANASAFGMGGVNVLPPSGASNGLWAPNRIADKPGIYGSVWTGLTHMNEERQMPLYDTFEDRVGWKSYVKSGITYSDFAAFAGYRAENEMIPAIALGYAPLYNTNYTYSEQIREIDGVLQDQLVGIWRIESEGRLAGPVVAISEDILEYATVGISAAFVSGELSMSRSAPAGDSLSYNAEDWEAVFSADTHYTAEISGTHLTLAAAAYPTERWQIGLRYSPGMETGDTLYPSLLPGRIGIGIGYLPPGHVVSRFVAEAEMVQYSQLAEEDSVNYGSLQDIWNFRVGLEHILHGGMPMRVGAYYKCVPLPETITRLGFTIGSGASFGPAELNVAAGYEMSEYSHHDQFPETWLPNSPDDRDDYDRVKEGKLIGSISLDIHF